MDSLVRLNALAPLFVVLLMLLAGCAAGEPASDAPPTNGADPLNPEDLPTDGTGILTGLVVSGENAPIVGALAAVDGGQPVSTGQDGQFRVRGLAPGSHRVEVLALGYTSTARNIEIIEGQEVKAIFTLQNVPVQEPYIELVVFKGFSQCDYMVYVISGRLPPPCDSGQAASRFDVNVTKGWQFLVVEMKWQGGFANSDTFRLFTADDGDCVDGSPCYGLMYGRGYARVEGEPGKTELVRYYDPWMDERGPPYPENETFLMVVNGQWIGAFAEELGDNPVCQAILETATGTGYKRGCLGFGVSTGIPYDLYVSIFHFMQPEDRGPCCPATKYSAIPDA